MRTVIRSVPCDFNITTSSPFIHKAIKIPSSAGLDPGRAVFNVTIENFKSFSGLPCREACEKMFPGGYGRVEEGGLLHMAHAGNAYMRIDFNRRFAECYMVCIDRWHPGFFLNYIFYYMISAVYSGLGYLSLHASSVHDGENGILICGDSGSGKSTLSYLLERKYGLRLFSGDKTLFSLKDESLLRYPERGLKFRAKQGIMIKHIVFPDYGTKSPVKLSGISSGQALVGIMKSLLYVPGKNALRITAPLVKGKCCWRLRYPGSIDAAAAFAITGR